MDPIFELATNGTAREVRIGEDIYPVLGAGDGTAFVEVPLAVGQQNGWTRRLDLEGARRRQFEAMGEQLAAEMRAADAEAAQRQQHDQATTEAAARQAAAEQAARDDASREEAARLEAEAAAHQAAAEAAKAANAEAGQAPKAKDKSKGK